MHKVATFVTAILLGGCAGAAQPEFPHTFASEDQDAWLETHCARKAVLDTNANAFNEAMRSAGANFAELVAFHRDGWTVKAFACRVKPNWYGADSLDQPEES